MPNRTGQQIGNYQLDKLSGKGGFAEVYLGEHIHLNTYAAIKILRTTLQDQESIADFRQEARTIAQLIHPHIVRILDFGVEENIAYLVMDYAPGGTLRSAHPRGSRLPISKIIAYTKQVAEALDYAHSQKLVHRDIKPENMLLGRNGDVYLSDFGIATIAQSSRQQAAKDVAGTVGYMAPEQIQAHPRPASDQYSLAVVIYEWLAGQLPFQGTQTEIAMKHVLATPPPLHDLIAIPLSLERVILKALAKDPSQRFPSVMAFANALEQATRDQEEDATTVQMSSLETALLNFSSNKISYKQIAARPLPFIQGDLKWKHLPLMIAFSCLFLTVVVPALSIQTNIWAFRPLTFWFFIALSLSVLFAGKVLGGIPSLVYALFCMTISVVAVNINPNDIYHARATQLSLFLPLLLLLGTTLMLGWLTASLRLYRWWLAALITLAGSICASLAFIWIIQVLTNTPIVPTHMLSDTLIFAMFLALPSFLAESLFSYRYRIAVWLSSSPYSQPIRGKIQTQKIPLLISFFLLFLVAILGPGQIGYTIHIFQPASINLFMALTLPASTLLAAKMLGWRGTLIHVAFYIAAFILSANLANYWSDLNINPTALLPLLALPASSILVGILYEILDSPNAAVSILSTVGGSLILSTCQVWMQTLLYSTDKQPYIFGWNSIPIIIVFTCLYAIPALLIEWSLQRIVQKGESIAEQAVADISANLQASKQYQ